MSYIRPRHSNTGGVILPLELHVNKHSSVSCGGAMTLVPIKMEFLHKYGEIINKTCIKIILMLLQINFVINNLVTIF